MTTHLNVVGHVGLAYRSGAADHHVITRSGTKFMTGKETLTGQSVQTSIKRYCSAR